MIARFFARPLPGSCAVVQGVGDDCALLNAGDRLLAVTSDLLVQGRHFYADVDAEALGHKALAVNLSDLAAAGAAPRCFFLALALPRADETWLAGFARGLFALADRYGCALAGGDTTRAPRVGGQDGPLSICITAIGEVPPAVRRGRDGARPGDDLWVSGTLGEAALALAARAGEVELPAALAASARARLERPQPRIELGLALRGLASACIDVSDGLLGDLRHVLTRSGVGAVVHWPALPLGAALAGLPWSLQARCALAGGDDYELLFTAPAARRAAVLGAADRAGTPVTRIGAITEGRDLQVLDARGEPMDTPFQAYDHFACDERAD
ncbi:MAG: thiamine-phosphate kinase [Burkholderiaceae bacterium]|nr:thiamine-phosphate kinase [Burkholderiaceae bacterium]